MKSVILAIALLSGSDTAPDYAISDDELSLGGVALGDSESQVVAALGPPLQQSDTGEGYAFEYPGLTVMVGWLEEAAPGNQRRAFQLEATGSNACTPSGVCPGSPASKVLATYGQPVMAERSHGNFWEYYSSQSSCWLQLSMSNDTVLSINAVCQP